MQNSLPEGVTALLRARDGPTHEAAWGAFVASYTPLLLHVARSLVKEPDEAMDAYAWLLDRLKEDGSRRLRGFREGGRAKFTTWLVVVARRLCVDWLRHCRGRTPVGGVPVDPSGDGHALRRRLRTLAGEPALLETLADGGPGADGTLERAEVHDRLLAAIAGLAPADRLLITLRFEDTMNAADIARALQLPTPFHVYRRLNHVLEALRRSLAASGIDALP